MQPYDVRPALAADMDLISGLLTEQFGDIPLPKVVLLNKAGGVDRADLIIIHGYRFGWLTFDPVAREFNLDIDPDALPYVLPYVEHGIVNLEVETDVNGHGRRIGGKRFSLTTPRSNGTVIISYKDLFGTGVIKDGSIRVKKLIPVEPQSCPDPDWDEVIEKNQYHLKGLERNAVRTIRRYMNARPSVNVSFSGGKDSTVIFHLARRAGVEDAFFIDSGIELPETREFVAAHGIKVIRREDSDFFKAVEEAGPPGKDNRWCCNHLKLQPLKDHLSDIGPCVTIQGNRWYESWNRADLDVTNQNPENPLQLNISPIRHWRALEVFLYIWWKDVPINPLYDRGLERIGCYLCPAALEAEYERLREMHPELTGRWDEFLERWAKERGLPDAYHQWGLWRWQVLPPKMREICRDHGILLNDDYTVRSEEP